MRRSPSFDQRPPHTSPHTHDLECTPGAVGFAIGMVIILGADAAIRAGERVRALIRRA